MAAPGRALRVQVEQFGRRVARLARGAPPGAFPGAAAQLVQGRRLGRAAGVPTDQVQLRDRHVELVAAGVVELQELGHALALVEADQPGIAPDAMLLVHHRVADAHLGQVAQHVLGGGPPSAARAPAARLLRVELGLGDHGQRSPRQPEPGRERPGAQHPGCVRREEGGEIRDLRQPYPVIVEQLRDRLASAGALGEQQHPRARCAGGGGEVDQRGERAFGAPVHRQGREG